MKLLPEHVEGARGMLKLSVAELAHATGISEKTLRRFEDGSRAPGDEILWRIQTALEQRGIEFFNSGSPGVRYNPAKAIIPKGS